MNKMFLGLILLGLLTLSCMNRRDKPVTTANKSVTPVMVAFEDLTWIDLPERMGMQYSVISGDPKTGAYSQIRKVPAGTNNPPHSHSSRIRNVIISGIWYTGIDSASARDFGPGSVVEMPADWVHVSGCRPGSDCVFYQEGDGKFDFNPVEDGTADK